MPYNLNVCGLSEKHLEYKMAMQSLAEGGRYHVSLITMIIMIDPMECGRISVCEHFYYLGLLFNYARMLDSHCSGVEVSISMDLSVQFILINSF